MLLCANGLIWAARGVLPALGSQHCEPRKTGAREVCGCRCVRACIGARIAQEVDKSSHRFAVARCQASDRSLAIEDPTWQRICRSEGYENAREGDKQPSKVNPGDQFSLVKAGVGRTVVLLY